MMTNEQLAKIQAMADTRTIWNADNHSIFTDVEALLAEIARLRAERESTAAAYIGMFEELAAAVDGVQWPPMETTSEAQAWLVRDAVVLIGRLKAVDAEAARLGGLLNELLTSASVEIEADECHAALGGGKWRNFTRYRVDVKRDGEKTRSYTGECLASLLSDAKREVSA